MNLNRVLRDAIATGAARVTRKPLAALRHELAAVKRQVAELRRKLRETQKTTQQAAVAPASTADEVSAKTRFRRPTGADVRKLRAKLGLTQSQFGKLAGVSTLTVWKWERAEGRLVLRQRTIEAFRKVRGMGRREAQKALQ